VAYKCTAPPGKPGAIFELLGGKIIIDAHSYIDRGVILRALGGTIEISGDCSVDA